MAEKEKYNDEPIIEDDETGEPLEIEEPDEDTDEEEEEDEDDSDGEYSLGECRIHPPTPVTLFRGKGNKAEIITTETLLGNKVIHVYEFPPCVGMECETYWCSVHGICSFACRHEAECHSSPVESRTE